MDRDENAARNILALALAYLKAVPWGTRKQAGRAPRKASGQKTTTVLSAMGERQAHWMKEESPRRRGRGVSE